MLRLLSKCCTFSKFRFLFFHVKRNLQHSNCFIQPPFLGPAAIATSTALTRRLPNPPQFVQSSLMPAQGGGGRGGGGAGAGRARGGRGGRGGAAGPPGRPAGGAGGT